MEPEEEELLDIDANIATSQTVAIVSVVTAFYALAVMRRGLLNFTEVDFVGVLMGGYAGFIPVQYQKNIPRMLSLLTANVPGIVIPIIMYLFTYNFQGSPNIILLMMVLAYYLMRLTVGLVVKGYSVNIGDVVAEYALTCTFAYCHSACFCYLYDYTSAFKLLMLGLGLVAYGAGMVIYVYYEYKLKSLESMFRTRIAYTRGGLFDLVVAPQHSGEVLIVFGIFVASGTIIAAAHFIFILCHMMVLSNIRYTDLRERYGNDIACETRKLIPNVW